MLDRTDSSGQPGLSNLAIVGGCGSSGSTLLAHLVSRHSQIASGPEFNLFNHPEVYDLQELRSVLSALLKGKAPPAGYVDVPEFMTFRSHYGISDELIKKWVTQSDSASGFVSHVVLHILKELDGAKFFFEKSPTNAYCLAKAAQTLAGVKTVHLLRDGRDVACSLMRRGWNLFGAGSRWLYDTTRALEARGTPCYHEISYENLVTRPERELAKLLRHIEISETVSELLKPSESAPGLYNENWTARKEPRSWNQTPADPISANSIGKFRTTLTKTQLSALYRIRLSKRAPHDPNLPRTFGDLMEYLGYGDNDCHGANANGTSSRILLEGSDYMRRLCRFQNRNQLHVPRVYTRTF